MRTLVHVAKDNYGILRDDRYTRAAWLLAILIVVPIALMRAVSVPNVFLIVIDVTLGIFSFVCLLLIPSFSTSRLILQ